MDEDENTSEAVGSVKLTMLSCNASEVPKSSVPPVVTLVTPVKVFAAFRRSRPPDTVRLPMLAGSPGVRSLITALRISPFPAPVTFSVVGDPVPDVPPRIMLLAPGPALERAAIVGFKLVNWTTAPGETTSPPAEEVLFPNAALLVVVNVPLVAIVEPR